MTSSRLRWLAVAVVASGLLAAAALWTHLSSGESVVSVVGALGACLLVSLLAFVGAASRLGSEAEATHARLRESETRYRELFEANPHPMWVYDLETLAFLAVNDAAIRHYGYTREEFLGMTIKEIRPTEDVPRLLDNVAGVTEGVDEAGVWRHRKKDGDIIEVEITSHTLQFQGRRAELVLAHDVTQRRRSDAALREAEERYRLLVERSPFAIGVHQDERLVFANSAAVSLLGARDARDLIGRRIDEFVHPEAREAVRARIARMLAGEKDLYPTEDRYRRPDGTVVPVELTAVPVTFAGRPAVQVIALDVTNRKRAEEALRESEERLRLALVAADQGLYDLNVQTGEAVVSAQYALMIGYEPTEFQETTARWIERLHPDDREAVAARYHDYVAGRIPEYRVEFRQRTRDGHWKWILSLGRVVSWDEHGQPLRMLGTHTDITDRKSAELERALLARAIEQVADSVLITDTSWTIQYVNPAFEAVTGYTREEMIGQSPWILKSGEHDEAFYRSLEATLASGGVWRGRFINKRKDGSRYVDESEISPVRDPSGRIVNYVAVKRDMTGELRQAAERDRLQAQLLQAQKMESVGRLAGGVAHDFNNLLSVILGHAEMGLRRTTPAQAVRKDFDEIVKSARRSADLTRQLLAFARKQTVRPEVLDLNETVAGLLKLLRRLIGEEIELRFVPGPAVGRVRMDPSQLDQLLANLAVNARDAIEGVGRVTIRTARTVLDEAFCALNPGTVPGEHVVLTVKDDGGGMDENTLAHIFEPFFTTKGEGKGTGLGLATVYGIVKQNDGFIDVSSELGRGATFSIYLPRVEEVSSHRAAPDTPQPIPGGTETVLMVEDERALLAVVKETLEELGYTVLGASAPGEALRVAQAHAGDIHLVLTDVVMPELNGRELADRLCALHPGLKRLYMSGYTADVIAHRGVLEEGTHFIQKPFSTAQLAQKVREVLAG